MSNLEAKNAYLKKPNTLSFKQMEGKKALHSKYDELDKKDQHQTDSMAKRGGIDDDFIINPFSNMGNHESIADVVIIIFYII